MQPDMAGFVFEICHIRLPLTCWDGGIMQPDMAGFVFEICHIRLPLTCWELRIKSRNADYSGKRSQPRRISQW